VLLFEPLELPLSGEHYDSRHAKASLFTRVII
jgi:hypothetical protein